MASHTALVRKMSEGGIDANRPVEVARRVVTMLLVGAVAGTLFGFILFSAELTLMTMFLAMCPVLILLLVMGGVWLLWKDNRVRDNIPVVARTLATSESKELRYVTSGGNRGLLVPVVAVPADGGEPFRSIILLRQMGKGRVEEPKVGTLLALKQDFVGQGELSDIEEVTASQTALIEKLRRHPRQLSNNAPVAPMRRTILDRATRGANLQFWGSFGIGLAVCLFITASIARSAL
ncbi:hypothetical protein [Arcanobacterium canis]